MVERFRATATAESLSKRTGDRPGRFKKGMQRMPNAGRTKGVPNKSTRLIKDAITGAGAELGMLEPIYRYKEVSEKVGNRTRTIRVKTDEVVGWKPTGKGGLQGYLIWLGANHPQSFSSLLSRVLPLQINAKVEKTETVTTKFEKLDTKSMTLAEKMATLGEMLSLTQPRPEVAKLPKPGEEQYEEGEYEDVPAEAAE